MRRAKFLLLSVVVLTTVLVSCQNKRSSTIVGVWRIDSIYYENLDSILPKYSQYVVESYRAQLQAMQDSLQMLQKKQTLSKEDSFYMVMYQRAIPRVQQLIAHFSDPQNLKNDLERMAHSGVGKYMEFKKDSTFTMFAPGMPSYQRSVGRWTLKGDNLTITIGKSQTSGKIITLTNKELKFKTIQNVTKDLAVKAVFMLSKVKGKELKQLEQTNNSEQTNKK